MWRISLKGVPHPSTWKFFKTCKLNKIQKTQQTYEYEYDETEDENNNNLNNYDE